MMNFIRKHMQNKFTKVILWILLFGLSGLGSLAMFFSGKDAQPWVAKVNNQEVSFSDVNNIAEPMKHQIREIKKMFGKQASGILSMWGISPDKSVYDVAIDQLITEKATLSGAKKAGINISKEYIINKMQNHEFIEKHLGDVIPKYLFKDGKLDVSYLSSFLKEAQIPAEKFDEIIRTTLTKQSYDDLVKVGNYVTQDQIRKEYTQKNSKKKYEIITLSEEPFIKKAESDKTITSEKEIEAYYNAHKESYRVPETRSGKLWEFDISDKQKFNTEAKKAINDTDKLKEFIEKNKGKVSNIENLSNKDYSNKSSKLFSLKKVSDKAYYTEDKKGYIIELTKINESSIPEKNKVLSKVKSDIISKKSKDMLNNALKEAANNNAKIKFEVLAKNIKGQYKKTDFLDPEKLIEKEYKDIDMPANKISYVAHMDKIDEITTAIDDKKGYLVKLIEIEPINNEEFTKSRKSIYNNMINQEEHKSIKAVQDNLKESARVTLNTEIIKQLNKHA